MKKLLWPILLASQLCYAEFPISQIESFEGNYADPSGIAHADYFSIPQYNIGENAEFSVERQAGVFVLSTPYEDIFLDSLPESLYELQNLNWSGLNMNVLPLEFHLNVNNLDGSHTEGQMDLRGLSLTCIHSGIEDEVQNEFMDACLNNDMSFSLDSAYVKNISISNVSSSIQQNKMSFKLKVKGFNVMGSGESYFEPGLVRIKISKAKAGFINVKNMLFKELEAMENENIVIANPWIEISY